MKTFTGLLGELDICDMAPTAYNRHEGGGGDHQVSCVQRLSRIARQGSTDTHELERQTIDRPKHLCGRQTIHSNNLIPSVSNCDPRF